MRIVSIAPMGFSKFNILASAALAVMLAACSSSVERFAENPSNSDPVYTASVPKKKSTSYDMSSDESIVSKPLANAAVKPPKYSYNSSYKKPVYKQPVYQDDVASTEEPVYTEPTYKKPALKNTAMTSPAAATPRGATVRVGQGMTLYSIAKANGVSVGQLASANGIAAPYSVSAGRVLHIPGKAQAMLPKSKYVPSNDVATSDEIATPQAHSKKLSAGGAHTVASGETLFSLGRKYGMSPYAIADLNGLSHNKPLSVGQSLRIPGNTLATVATKPQKAVEQVADNTDEPQIVDAPKNLTAQNSLAAEEAPVVTPTAKQQTAELPSNPSGGTMRWPVKGKVISAYGAKPNGLKNEGINIAVPEGTGVRAAESGVVAYAGNELKGYGNLVLVRHEGGWVTAYAHASELFVKRGDTVKRGDVIAKAGQTGSVSSPQLHFEVRKGATAMDPMKFLANATASN
jgi:murein DD-endopeptidase MepM/ murein hydrolase activator NlpD